jgi:Ser/Thr protein kinase RdoA (MazF antagonist)
MDGLGIKSEIVNRLQDCKPPPVCATLLTIMERTVRRILDSYGLADYSLLPAQKGYRNHSFAARLADGSTVNLMLYKREPDMLTRIRRANAVANFAAAKGLPARRTRSEKIIRLSSPRGNSYAALYEYLPGRTIPWEAYTRKHLKLLGKAMSDLHAALQDFDAQGLPGAADEYLEIVRRMRRYFADPNVRRALAAKLRLTVPENIFDDFEQMLRACRHLPYAHALHMDFVRSNILFDDSGGEPAVSGILDFEKTTCGHPVFDIARTLAFLLVDCKYKQPEKIRKYFLHSGYRKRGAADFQNVIIKTSGGEIDVLESLLDLFLLHDFYKFLCHNPYEFLHQNEHFVRTRDILSRHLFVLQA